MTDQEAAPLRAALAGPAQPTAPPRTARAEVPQSAQGERRQAQPTRTEAAPARKPAADTGVPVLALRAVGVLALLFGVAQWGYGAFATLNGWALAINIVTDALRMEWRVGMPTGAWSLLLLPIGVVYSYAELYARPTRALARRFADWRLTTVFILVWLFILSSDWGTTLLTITTPAHDAWKITLWVATTPWAAVVATTFLTFAPEWFILLGLKLLTMRG